MRYKSLDEICVNLDSRRKPITATNRIAGRIPYYGASGIVDYVEDYIFDEDLLLVSEDGANLVMRSTPIAFSIEGKAWVNNHAHVLRFKDKWLRQFVELYLNSIDLSPYITGTAQPKLNQQMLNMIPIPIPNETDIKHIVTTLNKLKEITDLRKKQLQVFDALIKARFVELFGNPESDEKYPQIAIKDFTDVISGGTPDRKNNQYWENGTVPWVKTTELQNNRINSVEEYITEKGLNESSAKVVPVDTVLIAMYGQGKTRGMTAILGIPASTNQACACILPCETVEPKYLWQYMIMSYGRLRNLAQGGNQPNLNGNMIKNFTVLVPTVELQMQFVKFVEQVDKSKVAVQKALDETKLLFDSLMQQYFG